MYFRLLLSSAFLLGACGSLPETPPQILPEASTPDDALPVDAKDAGNDAGIGPGIVACGQSFDACCSEYQNFCNCETRSCILQNLTCQGSLYTCLGAVMGTNNDGCRETCLGNYYSNCVVPYEADGGWDVDGSISSVEYNVCETIYLNCLDHC
jgi:hypothetical protein